MNVLLPSVLLGFVAGLRTMTAPAAVSWAASLGWIAVGTTSLWFLAHAIAPWILSLLALVEFVTDQLPTTPSRTKPAQFGARLISGGVTGAAIGLSGGGLPIGVIGGVAGAVIGTLGGHRLRGWLAATFGSDRPAALLEDGLAVGLAALVVLRS